ncbi:MAG: adenylate/guanylate cyclase domain-containing protein [Tistlia sp.]|uniref:adenylate/guanylate cyclase domain-containing protein n=1 Tax=Tistlia sp. TaxID=3057121 RepID=UPI0034A40A29
MAGRRTREWVWRFEAPAEAVWRVLADTARFNEAAGLPKQTIRETPQPDGTVLAEATARQGPFRLAWRELPVNWVAGSWFEHCRVFTRGPLARLCARFRLTPEPDGGCLGHYRLEAEPAGAFGRLLLGTLFFKAAGESFTRLALQADRFAQGASDREFDYRAPPVAPATRRRVGQMVEAIEASGHGHGLARRLADFLLEAQEVDLARLRPLALARRWQLPERQAIELCLQATRTGLLELSWDLLCPRCRVAKAAAGSLDRLPDGAHCDSCNIDYGRDFSRNVELSFRPAEAVRPIQFGEYCLLGPMSTPHIRLHVTLPAGATRRVAASLAPGPYRLRSQEKGPERDLELAAGAGFPAVILGEESVETGAPAPAGTVELVNATPWPRTFVIEDRRWVAEALTADRVTALQAFRDLFAEQVLRPGDEVSVRRITLMFTDLAASTALYGRIGDARAYHLVREHFALLGALVRAHEGALVKTIGDAIMAAFADPAQALAAARAAQESIAGFNERNPDGPILLKVGLHTGPCIAVTLNERLDYFGGTVNLAARLQGESRGGEIVLSETLAAEPAVAEALAGLPVARESVRLKGFEAPVGILRIAS